MEYQKSIENDNCEELNVLAEGMANLHCQWATLDSKRLVFAIYVSQAQVDIRANALH